MPGLDGLPQGDVSQGQAGSPLILGGGQIQANPGALPAQWYTLFGISPQTAAAMNLKPTADQVAMFSAMQSDPKYASIFQQSASAQSTNWSYSDADKALVQQAATQWSGGKLNATPEQVNAANQAASPWNSTAVQQMMQLENQQGLSGQDAQSAVLGTNQYQKGIIGAGGGATGGGNFQDVSAAGYTAAPSWTPGMDINTYESQFAAWESSTRAAASTYANTLGAGIQNYYTKIGENDQGISQAQISANDATYASIQNSSEQQAWLAAQDPGNLSASLRAQWQALVLPQDQAIAAGNQTHEYVGGEQLTAMAPGQVPGSVASANGTFDVTIGSVINQDAATGRVTMIDNVPTAVDYSAPNKSGMDNAMDRLGGAAEGAFMGFAAGGPLGGVLGAVSGSGALGGLNGKGLGTWKWGQPTETGGLGAVTQFMTAYGIGALAGGLGLGARLGIGSALGAVSGMLTGGGGAEQNALSGGIGGALQGAFAGKGPYATPEVPMWSQPSIATGGPATVS